MIEPTQCTCRLLEFVDGKETTTTLDKEPILFYPSDGPANQVPVQWELHRRGPWAVLWPSVMVPDDCGFFDSSFNEFPIKRMIYVSPSWIDYIEKAKEEIKKGSTVKPHNPRD